MSDDSHKPPAPGPQSTPPRVAGSERVMPVAGHAPYDLAPVDDPSSAIPEPAAWTRDAASARPLRSGPAAGKVGTGRFIDSLPDDADLTDIGPDPRSTAANDQTVADRADTADANTPRTADPFIKGGERSPQLLMGAGLGLTIAAAVLAGVNAASMGGAWWASSVLAIFFTLVFSACGLVAVGAAAHLAGLAIGRFDVATARMFFLSALVMALGAIRIPPLGLFAGPVIVAMVLAGYWVAASVLFRQGPRRTLSLAAAHFAVSLALWILLQTYTLVHAATSGGVNPTP